MKKWIDDFVDVFHRNAIAGWLIAFYMRKGVLLDTSENALRFLGAFVLGMLVSEFGQIIGKTMVKNEESNTKGKLISFAIQVGFLWFVTAQIFT